MAERIILWLVLLAMKLMLIGALYYMMAAKNETEFEKAEQIIWDN